MGDKTGIQWTDASWNPYRGCLRVSPGCENCYAERQAIRMSSGAYAGLVKLGKQGPRWTGNARVDTGLLDQPLRWTKPRKIFVNSMSDLFFEKFTNEEIAAVFGVMAAAPQHVFQILTKRAKRMREWFEWVDQDGPTDSDAAEVIACQAARRLYPDDRARHTSFEFHIGGMTAWPLPNVWLGVSVENQQYADERIPELLRTPAAVRFVSYEPAIGPIDFKSWLTTREPIKRFEAFTPEAKAAYSVAPKELIRQGVDWVIVGGESGPGARPFDVAWARSVIAQCKSSGVACFVKQLGAHPRDCPTPRHGSIAALNLKDRKGGDMSEWSEDLRVREFPR